jgi:transposase-like protein
MNKKKRRTHDAQFKARVALEAIKGVKTVQQIGSEYDVHPVQVSEWKRKLMEQSALAFDPSAGARAADDPALEAEREKLHAKIGQLTVELDFLRRKSRQLGVSVELPTWLKTDTHA